MYARVPVRPFSVLETTYISRYPYVRDDAELNDRAVIPMIEAVGTVQQLLAAIQWIVPGGVSDVEACLRLLRLRDELTREDWRSALDPHRPSSNFTQLARRLYWRSADRTCAADGGESAPVGAPRLRPRFDR
jgi:hypothetical protein